MQPLVDHIQLTVRNLDGAAAFHDRLMPLLGFDPRRRTLAEVAAHELRVVEYSHPALCFAITSPRPAFANDPIHRRRIGTTPAWKRALFCERAPLRDDPGRYRTPSRPGRAGRGPGDLPQGPCPGPRGRLGAAS